MTSGTHELNDRMLPANSNSQPAPQDASDTLVRMPAGQRIMLLTYSLPPALNGSTAIADQLSREFSPAEMIVVGASWPGKPPPNDPQIPKVYRVGSAWRWPQRGSAYLRWMRWFTLPILMLRLWWLRRRNNCRWLVVVFPDHFFLFAGYLLAILTRTPLYPYFHNSYEDNQQDLKLRFARWLEPRVIRRAEIVFVMSEGLRRHFQAKYPHQRFVPLLHTFHGEVPDVGDVPPARTPLRIALLGTLNHSNNDAIRRFYEAIKDDDTCQMTIFSGTTPAWAYARRGIDGPHVTVTTAAPDDVGHRLAQHDVLYLPHGLQGGLSAVEYATIFPTRTISYLISGRPILAHAPTGSFLAEFLRQHDCAELVCDPDVDALRAALERLRSDDRRRRQLVENALLAARPFQGRLVAGGLRRMLLETVSLREQQTL